MCVMWRWLSSVYIVYNPWAVPFPLPGDLEFSHNTPVAHLFPATLQIQFSEHYYSTI